MNGAKFALYCVIVCMQSFPTEASPCNSDVLDESKKYGSNNISDEDLSMPNQWFEPIAGLKINYAKKELFVRLSSFDKQDNAVESRDSDKEKRPKILKKIGTFITMIPIGLQLLQLPVAIASIKMSLIKSILVAKVALVLLLIRSLLTSQKQEIVIVRSPPKESHEHFYHPFEDPEDNKPGWLGGPLSWFK